MIFDLHGKPVPAAKPEPTVLHQRIRTWLDVVNQARESHDPVDAARIGPASQEVATVLQAVQSGHIQPQGDSQVLLMLIGLTFHLSPNVPVFFKHHKPTARRLIYFLREIEDDMRLLLAVVTQEPVSLRSTANDANEEKHFEGA